MRSFTAISFLFLLAFPLSSFLSAANVQSVKTGAWDDPTVWSSGAIPGPNDDVTIKVGHSIQTTQANPPIVIKSFTVEATGVFLLGERNFRVNGPTNISGVFKDEHTTGVNYFQDRVRVHTGGVWNTIAITANPNKLTFIGGIGCLGGTMKISVAYMTGRNQTITGTSQIEIIKELNIAAGITVTNSNTGGMFFNNGQVRGEDATATFVNQALLVYHDRNAPMTPGSVDFSQAGNTVIYGRRDKQFIRPTTHYNMVIDDHELDDENFKFLQPGMTRVTNEFTINLHAEIDGDINSMEVSGTTRVFGELFDGKDLGTVTLSDVVVDGGMIHGHPWESGNFIILGDLTLMGQNVTLEDGNLDVRGTTTVKAGTRLLVDGGGTKVKKFNEFIVEAGADFIDIANKGSLVFRKKLNILEGDLYLKQDAHFENGMEHFAGPNDTLVLKGQLFFDKNNQTWHTNKGLEIEEPINVSAGVRAVVAFDEGVIVPDDNNVYFQGENNTAKYANGGKMTFTENEPFGHFSTITPDFSEPGNELIMVMTEANAGFDDLPSGTFHSLTVINERADRTTLRTILPDQIEILGDFTITENIILNPRKQSLNVGGWGRIYGTIFDNELDGKMTFANLELGRCLIDGNNWRHGTFEVLNELVVSDSAEITEAIFSVNGLTTIKPFGMLMISTKEGDRGFGGFHVEEGGSFIDNTQGEDMNFDGPMTLDGSFALGNGNCEFTHPIIVNEKGTFTFSKEWGRYNFSKGIINNGTVALGNGYFTVTGEVGGNALLELNSNIIIPADDTLKNTNTAGFTIGGSLDGESEGSVFINQGVFNYAPRSASVVMETGTFDRFSDPNNWVNFSSTSGWQEIETGAYRNVGFLNGGNKKLKGGNIEIHGDIRVEGTTVRKAQDPFSVGVALIVGTEDQHISGDVTGLFEELFIEKPSGKVILDNDFGITGTLLMKSGLVDATVGGLFLANNSFLQESESSYVYGKVASLKDICEGCSHDFGGLGLRIQSGSGVAMGPTTVVRHTGRAYAPGQITRFYEVFPTNNENLNASIEFSYLEREINGAVEKNLDIVLSTDGSEFTVLGGKNLTKSNVVTKTKIQEFGIISLVANTTAINAFPSPMLDGNLNVDYVVEEDMEVDLKIFDRTGRTFVRRTVPSLAGVNRFKLEDVQLPSGVYFIRIVAGDKVGTQTFLKITP